MIPNIQNKGKNVDLSKFKNDWYNTGGNLFKRSLWYFINSIILKSYFFPFGYIKIWLLRLFGAKIGHSVIIKPGVNIKYPWNLHIANYTWIGEGVWIDNLEKVIIGNHVCISQGALLLCGNHNFKSVNFDLIVAPIKINDGAWIGAKSVVCPGVTVGNHAVLTVGSIATSELKPNGVYKGNPALFLKERKIIA